MSAIKNEEIPSIKLILMGASAVGKTSIATYFTTGKFDTYSEATMGAAFMIKKHTIPQGKTIDFHIWDTAGQEKYRSIAPVYYRQAKIALFVYDITSEESFQSMKSWVEEVKTNGPTDAVYAVVGNKTDLIDQETVNYKVVEKYAGSIGAIYRLVSAKEGKNIENLFNTVAYLSLQKQRISTQLRKSTQLSKVEKSHRKKCC